MRDRLPVEPRGHGLIVCSSVLSFVDDYAGAVRDLFDHLAPDGLIAQWDWEADPDQFGGGLSREVIRSVLAGARLESAVDGRVMAFLMGSGSRRR